MPLGIAEKLEFQPGNSLKGPAQCDESLLQIDGTIRADIWDQGKCIKKVVFYMNKKVKQPLLSVKVLKELRLIPQKFPFIQVTSVDKPEQQRVSLGLGPKLDLLANHYPMVFSCQVEPLKGERAKIELTPDAQPCSSGAIRDIPKAKKEAL